MCIALLAHDKDVCVVGELSVLCTLYHTCMSCVLVHLWPCRYIYGPVGVRVGKSGVGLLLEHNIPSHT